MWVHTRARGPGAQKSKTEEGNITCQSGPGAPMTHRVVAVLVEGQVGLRVTRGRDARRALGWGRCAGRGMGSRAHCRRMTSGTPGARLKRLGCSDATPQPGMDVEQCERGMQHASVCRRYSTNRWPERPAAALHDQHALATQMCAIKWEEIQQQPVPPCAAHSRTSSSWRPLKISRSITCSQVMLCKGVAVDVEDRARPVQDQRKSNGKQYVA